MKRLYVLSCNGDSEFKELVFLLSQARDGLSKVRLVE